MTDTFKQDFGKLCEKHNIHALVYTRPADYKENLHRIITVTGSDEFETNDLVLMLNTVYYILHLLMEKSKDKVHTMHTIMNLVTMVLGNDKKEAEDEQQ